MLASVYLWNSAFAEQEVLEGLYLQQMVTYAVLAVVVSTLFTTGVENQISNGVYSGSIATFFLRPVRMFGMFFSDDMGSLVASIFLRTLPALIVGILFFRMRAPESAAALALALISVTFSFIIVWLISAIVGLFTFWAMNLGNLSYLKNVIISIFSGRLIPLWFFPQRAQDVFRFLPFQYTYQAPIAIYIGQTGADEAVFVIFIQIIWVALLFILMNLIWRRARKRVMVQGG